MFPDNATAEFTVTPTGAFVYSQSNEFLPGNTWSYFQVMVKIANP